MVCGTAHASCYNLQRNATRWPETSRCEREPTQDEELCIPHTTTSMLSSAHRPSLAAAALTSAATLLFVCVRPVPGASKIATFKSSEPSGATGSFPEEYNYNCYEEHVNGDPCLRSRRTSHWDHKGPDKLIQFEAVVSRLGTDMCCPIKPPPGVCYHGYEACATGFDMVYEGPGIRNTLCCAPNSCFWFEMGLINCDPPEGYTAVDQTASCSQKGWKLVCPTGKDVSKHALSTEPLDFVKYSYK